MTKKSNKQESKQGVFYKTIFNNGNEKYLLPIVLILTFIVFFSTLQNKFINLDDPQYIIDNPTIKKINFENVKTIFSEQFVGNYQPLTMLSYLADYSLFSLQPFGYHLVNLIFHLLNTFLIFLIVKKIMLQSPSLQGDKNATAFITSLLFGIHTIHVESVAWASERKDVLYGFFFLLSLYFYILHIKHEKRFSNYLLLSLLFFVCSMLSKAQAVVLPFVFFSVDFLLGRMQIKEKKIQVIEKLPFFILAVVFGFLAIKMQGKAGAMQSFQYFPFQERILFSCYALTAYLHKIILPINLSCFYSYPETNDKINSVWVYISPVILFVLVFLVWRYFRNLKVVLFGIFFFIITILLLLQLIPVGDALYADRYTYIPSIGLFFIMAYYISLNLKNNIVLTVTLFYLLFICYLTIKRDKEWHDSISLYTSAIDNGYKAPIIFNNRGAVLSDSSRNEEALNDFTALLALKPKYPNGWRNKAIVQERLGQNENALASYTEAIKYFPDDAKNYFSRGALLEKVNNFEPAITDFSKAIELDPLSNAEYYSSRAKAYGKSGKLNEALTDINKAIELAPDNWQALNNRGIIFSMTGKYNEAVEDFTKSITINNDNIDAYVNRALALKATGKYENALQDALTAKAKGAAINESTITELKNLATLK